MLVTSITGVIEPISYSLTESLSWGLTLSLQEKKEFYLTDQTSQRVGQLVGIVPILQPIKIAVDENSGFLIFLRMLLDVDDNFGPSFRKQYQLSNASGKNLGALSICSVPQTDKPTHIMSCLLVPTGYVNVTPTNIDGLGKYIVMLRAMMWNSEPINWTTHNLHLTGSGTFMSALEIAHSGASGGVLSVTQDIFAVEAGPAPMMVSYRPSWNNAGKVTSMLNGAASCSTASTSHGSGTGTGGTGSGGDRSTCSDERSCEL